MSEKVFKVKAIPILCNNCHTKIVGLQDEKGVTRIHCPRCGSVTVSKVMGRRHVRLDVYAPQGQVLIDDD